MNTKLSQVLSQPKGSICGTVLYWDDRWTIYANSWHTGIEVYKDNAGDGPRIYALRANGWLDGRPPNKRLAQYIERHQHFLTDTI
jgi:hypothetical protein